MDNFIASHPGLDSQEVNDTPDSSQPQETQPINTSFASLSSSMGYWSNNSNDGKKEEEVLSSETIVYK